MTPPARATVRGPLASWIRPPMKVPMKIMPIETENGRAASDLLSAKSLPVACKAFEKTLQEYTAPSASCSSTAATTSPQRGRVGLLAADVVTTHAPLLCISGEYAATRRSADPGQGLRRDVFRASAKGTAATPANGPVPPSL